jgi:hypothetical protein
VVILLRRETDLFIVLACYSYCYVLSCLVAEPMDFYLRDPFPMLASSTRTWSCSVYTPLALVAPAYPFTLSLQPVAPGLHISGFLPLTATVGLGC